MSRSLLAACWSDIVPHALDLRSDLGVDVVGASMHFDANDFDPSAFTSSNIELTAAVARSVPKRQAEYLAGRLCARHALSVMGKSGEVGTGQNREPLWPQGVVGSITHNGERAVAAVADMSTCAGLGIDLESVVPADSVPHLVGLVVTEEEVERLRLHPQGLLQALTLAFSVKESFFKAAFLHVGRYFDFDAVELTEFNEGGTRLRLTVRLPLADSLMPGRQIDAVARWLDANTVLTACVLLSESAEPSCGKC